MNTTSHDVDIALDTMMGYDFAMWVGDYVQNVLHQPDIIGHHIAKIKSNPEKSKHLETATVRIYGMDIDFVNLRREVYEPGSRIPQIVCENLPLIMD
jgi:tRNA nucleotidyltransferase (CCA-adding enzyme)